MVTTSRRAGRVTNKTKLLIYRGSDKVDLALAEVIVWENQHDGNSSSSDGSAQPHHVGAIGVESNELLEHHLQAALSSASLIHSRAAAKPSSPTPTSRQKPDTATGTSDASLNYHIPTPDATGLVGSADFNALYQQVKYHEPVNYVRYSETVEESCSGAGGLGYCMDEDDEKWLTGFNAKAEGGSGTEHATSPLRESTTPNGRERRTKGKDKEKDKERETPLTTLSISEDTFEYVMGMMEKYVEDEIPMLHTDLAQMPQFPAIEHLFASPVPASFYPAYEVPKGLPDSKVLTRMARNIYHHWRQRREIRKGKSIFPSLNYDEANDGDPYVCFRRRDIRATRKTRRTDNYSVEKFQKLQYELQTAHQIVSMVQNRERLKQSAFKSDRELWEAKWKFYETKRKWPSLGVSREEEEFITGRTQQQQARAAESAAAMNGAHALSQQNANIARKKQPDRERDERERRERAIELARAAEKGVAAGGRSMAPEHYKERMQALRQKYEDAVARRASANADWDDLTDSSYQPLPRPASEKNFRTSEYLLPNSSTNRDSEGVYRPAAFRLRIGRGGCRRLDRRTALVGHHRGKQPSSLDGYADWLFPDSFADKEYSDRPRSIDGYNLADYAVDPEVEDVVVGSAGMDGGEEDKVEDTDLAEVVDDSVEKVDGAVEEGKVDDVETDKVVETANIDTSTEGKATTDADVEMVDSSKTARVHAPVDDGRDAKRRRLNEMRRYDVDSGGAVGVGMGVAKDDDRVIIDDLDPKYIRHRVSLLHSEDLVKLGPDMSIIAQVNAILDTPVELPALPQFVRPDPPMAIPLAQQQMLQQQHVERFQAVANQYAQQQAYNQQVAVAQANLQMQQQQQQHQQQQLHPMQPPQMQLGQQGQSRAPSDSSNGHASPAVNQQNQGMLPPQSTGQNGRPPIVKRPSSQNGNHANQGLPNVAIAQGQGRPAVSPTYNMQQGQQMNGSPQHANGLMLPNGKPVIGPNGQMDPNMKRMLAARMHQQKQQQQQQQQDGSNPNPLGNANVNSNIAAAGLNAIAQMSPEQQQQIAQLAEKNGFGNNVVAFLEQRNNDKVKQRNEQAALAVQQAQAQVQGQAHGQGQGNGNQRQPSAGSNNGSQNGNGNGNGSSTPAPDSTFASPQLPSGSLNLKLPAHATKRLGNNQTPNSPAQRAS